MGKISGFLELERRPQPAQEPAERKQHWREFIAQLDDGPAVDQAARCMDCGIPFCHNGCPVHNVIPDFNELVYKQDWQKALDSLHATNNFPEFTGRICPAPCEAACTLEISSDPVGIKSIERKIIDRGWAEGWVRPLPAEQSTGKRVAVVGSGPAGLAAAQQLARAGHAVTVFEKNDRPGGLLRYGIPDFKLEKRNIDRRIEQMRAEGVQFACRVHVGDPQDSHRGDATESLDLAGLQQAHDAVILAAGSETARDLPISGRDLAGVHFAMDFLAQQNRINAGDAVSGQISAQGRHVVVIGGGDTGSDCVGTSNRQGAASVTQFELLPRPPEQHDKSLTWPFWPLKLRTSSSHEEGCQRDWSVATKRFNADDDGRVASITAVRLDWQDGKMVEKAGSEFEIPADLVLLAMGFVSPRSGMLDALGVERDARGNARAACGGATAYRTSIEKVYAAGDVRRGQSLVVWAIREGRQCARAVDIALMGQSNLPL